MLSMLSPDQWVVVLFVAIGMYGLGWLTLFGIQQAHRNKRMKAIAADQEARRKSRYENKKNNSSSPE